jgi:hypothetical protein
MEAKSLRHFEYKDGEQVTDFAKKWDVGYDEQCLHDGNAEHKWYERKENGEITFPSLLSRRDAGLKLPKMMVWTYQCPQWMVSPVDERCS